jgi:hypothetical protein
MDRAQIVESLEKFIVETKNSKEKLIERIPGINEYQNRLNVGKTVGNGTSILGAGLIITSLALAPITGGVSIVAMTGVGSALALAGGVVSVGAEVVDVFASKSFQEEFSAILCKREDSVTDLKIFFNEIETITKTFSENEINEEDSMICALYLIKKGYDKNSFEKEFDMIREAAKNLMSLGSSRSESWLNAINLATKKSHLIEESFKLMSIASVSKNFANFSIRNGGKFWKNMRLLSRRLFPNLGKKTAMSIVRNSTIVLTAGFAIFDIYSIVSDWSSKHPTIAVIDEAIRSLNEDLENMEALKEYFKNDNDEDYDD